MKTQNYEVRSVLGKPLAIFETYERAKDFRTGRAARGVTVKIFQITRHEVPLI